MGTAEEYSHDPAKTTVLIKEAMKKVKNIEVIGGAWNYLTSFNRMVKSYMNRSYTDVPTQTIVAAIGVLIYFVVPTDLIPDFLPAVGYIDDVGVLSLVARSIKVDLDAFLAWEQEIKKVTKRKSSRSQDYKDSIEYETSAG